MKNYDEMVREAEEFMGTDRELEGLVPVKARVANPVRHVYSVRMSGKELDEISDAAKARGMTTSEFMRKAAMAAVHGELDLNAEEHRAALHAVRERAKELYEAVEKLEPPAGDA
jgi:hypothetical protein